MLAWSKEPLPTSLTILEAPYVKQSTRLFKNIQGFMGDKALSYPNALAQDLLDQGTRTVLSLWHTHSHTLSCAGPQASGPQRYETRSTAS